MFFLRAPSSRTTDAGDVAVLSNRLKNPDIVELLIDFLLLGVRFADSSSSSSASSRSNLSDQQNGDEESAAAVAAETSSSLLCSMVDRATLNKLTKEDLLLLWQAAESEWLGKVRSLAKQRDILQLRYQHASSLALLLPPPPTGDTTN